MVIGIQNNNRLLLPGMGNPLNGPGLSLSDATLESSSGLDPVDTRQSTPVADQPAIVQLNFSGSGALDRALLAGDQASPDPNAISQDLTAPPVQGTGPSATGVDGLAGGSWVPQALARQVAQLGLGGGLGASLLDGSFINATRDFASALLNGASARAAHVVPLATAGGENATGETAATSGDGPSKLSLLVDLLTDMTPGLSEQGKAQLKRLGHAVQDVQKTIQESDVNTRLQAAQSTAAQAARRGFTFEIEMRQSSQVDVTVAQLNENGFQAVRLQASSESVTRIRVTVGGTGGSERSDPVVLDLNRDGQIDLGALSAGGGQAFDINGDGTAEQTSFVAGGDAFLALDRNGNGRIDDGTELFGDQRGAKNGMTELAKLDADGDGRITRRDPLYGQLSAFFDLNGDGKVAQNEFKPISQLGITALNLNYQAIQAERADGNALSARSLMEYADGSTGLMADADLTNKPAKA